MNQLNIETQEYIRNHSVPPNQYTSTSELSIELNISMETIRKFRYNNHINWKKARISHIFNKICPCCGKSFKGIAHQTYCSKNCTKNRPIQKICIQCGKEYIARFYERTGLKKNFCSKECSKIHWRKKSLQNCTMICLNCGKEYILSHPQKLRKFCTSKCYFEYKHKQRAKNLITQKCIQCGKEFTRSGGDKKFIDQKFCSLKCHSDSHKIERECLFCHNKFTTTAHGKKKFCSIKCRHDSHRITKTCPICKKEFIVLCEGKTKVFCSQRCFSMGRKRIYREKLKEKVCIICGVKIESSIKYCLQCRTVKCIECGKEFTLTSQKMINKRAGQKSFCCSQSCASSYHSLPKEKKSVLLNRIHENISTEQLSKELGISTTTIRNYRKKYNILTLITKKCLWCGNDFQLSRHYGSRQKFCTPSCCQKYQNSLPKKPNSIVPTLSEFLKQKYPSIYNEYFSQMRKLTLINQPFESKKCVICGTTFQSNHSREIYCSRKCLKQAYYNRHPERREIERNQALVRKKNSTETFK